ncbi:MAG TPA: hypothetical protein VGI78_02595 [Acetobacteraceae bacterium]|jgi:hypothetical protein
MLNSLPGDYVIDTGATACVSYPGDPPHNYLFDGGNPFSCATDYTITAVVFSQESGMNKVSSPTANAFARSRHPTSLRHPFAHFRQRLLRSFGTFQ